jgi:hypothetical protein
VGFRDRLGDGQTQTSAGTNLPGRSQHSCCHRRFRQEFVQVERLSPQCEASRVDSREPEHILDNRSEASDLLVNDRKRAAILLFASLFLLQGSSCEVNAGYSRS